MQIEKAKISKADSFALKSSALQQAMDSAGISIESTLLHVSSPIFFDVHFWPIRPGQPNERLYIRAGAVPNPLACEARAYMENEVIPSFIQWVTRILSLQTNAPERQSERVFSREFCPRTPN
ncbi:hypothetical protein [Solilutibacter silvestris]|uniref:hypothetical protein n=1 Tax=Solilutibacter silvestris TaxID=1645665 RepID=UPI003D33624F